MHTPNRTRCNFMYLAPLLVESAATVQCGDRLVNYFVQLIAIGLTMAEQCGEYTHSLQLGASGPCHITKRAYYIPTIFSVPF